MRLGIFGGTFDPPHLGHLILAAEAADCFGLERVLWVITPDPPHKHFQRVSPLEVRIKLLRAAIGTTAGFEISRVDIDRPGPQYAVDTVRLLREANPGCELTYLIGGDSLRDLPHWYAPGRLLATIDRLGIMRRPGDQVDLDELERALPGIGQKMGFVDAPLLEISSSSIRERVAEGRHFRFFVPERVNALIEEMKLYRQE